MYKGQNFEHPVLIKRGNGTLRSPDSLPIAIVRRNGVDEATTVTVTNIITGEYTASFAVDNAWIAGDRIHLRVESVVAGRTLVDIPFLGVVEEAQQTVNVTAVGGNAVAAPADLKNTEAEVHGYLDSYTNKSAWTDKNTAADIHAALDSYANKDDYKATTVNPSPLASYIGGGVYYDEDGGTAGAVLGTNGTFDNPVDNFPDAANLAAQVAGKILVGNIDTAPDPAVLAAFSGHLVGAPGKNPLLNLPSGTIDLTNTWIENVVLAGAASQLQLGDFVHWNRVSVTSATPLTIVTGQGSLFEKCAFLEANTLTMDSAYFLDSRFTANTIISFYVTLKRCSGEVTVRAQDDLATAQTVIEDHHGDITIDGATDGSVLIIGGSGRIIISNGASGFLNVRGRNDDCLDEPGVNTMTKVFDDDRGKSVTTFHAALDSYANKPDWRADVANLSVNVTQVGGNAVTGPSDFWINSATFHNYLNTYTNKADWQADVSNLSVTADVTAVAGNAITSIADFKNSQTEIHTFLDAYTNKADWQADVSSLNAGVNVASVNNVAVTGPSDLKNSAAEIHAALNSYTNKDDYKATIPAVIDANIVQVASVAVTGVSDFHDQISEAEFHAALDSYTNKSAWQADVSGLNAGVNVTSVGGNAVTGPSDFWINSTNFHAYLDSYTNKSAWHGPGADETSFHNYLDSYANKGDWQDEANASEIHAALDSYTNKDDWHLPEADLHSYLNSYTNKAAWKNNDADIHAALDTYGNKNDWKADVSSLNVTANVTAVNGNAVTDVTDFHDQISEAELHTALDNYSNKGDWQDKNTQTEIHTFLDNYANKAAWQYDNTDLHVGLDSYANKADWQDKNTSADIHAALDSYTNKSDWFGPGVSQANLHTYLDNYGNKADWTIGETAFHAHLDSYANKSAWTETLPEASFHSFLNSYTSKDDWKFDPAGVTIGANILEVTGTSVTDVTDFHDKNTASDIHTALDSYTNKDNWKFDPTGVTVNANIVQVTGTAVTDITDFHDKADVTGILSAIDNLNDLSTGDVHNALDSYTNKAAWQEKNTELEIHAFLDNYANKAAWTAVADLTPVLTEIGNLNDVSATEVRAAFNASEFQDKLGELEFHQFLDSYTNKNNWKADLGTLSNDVNIISVAGNPVGSINDFRADLTQLLSVAQDGRNRSKYTASNTPPLNQP